MRALGACMLILIVPADLDSSRWWRSPRYVAALYLRPEQAREINAVYERSIPECRERSRAARRARQHMTHLLIDEAMDEELERGAIAAIEADAEANKARALMLARMYRVLTPPQRVEMQRLAVVWGPVPGAGQPAASVARQEVLGW